MAYIDWWNRTGPATLGERFGLNGVKRVALAKGVSGGWWGDWELNYKDQMTFEEYKQDLDIDKNPSGLEKAEGGRIGFNEGTTREQIKKATKKKYKDFVKAFKKKNKRKPSMSEIRTQIKGGGDWETIRKYLVEGEDFLTKSETLKMVQPAKVLIEDMPKGMDAWLKKEKINIVWEDIGRADRAKLKKRFANRNNPYFKGLEQKKIFEDHIERLIKKGETGAWEKSIEDLVKDSKANINRDVAQDIITDKKFAVKGTSMTRLYPKLEARAIELLTQGLSGPEVTTTLENEGIIKVRTYWDEQAKIEKRDIRPFTRVYENLLKEGKVKKITKTIPGLQIPLAERNKINTAIFDYMKKNPDIDSAHQVAKAVSAEINRDITADWVKRAIEKSGQDPDKLFQSAHKKIFSDVKALDKIIKNNQKLLADPNVTFADKSRILTKRYAEATRKPFKIAAGEFITRMRKLGNLYSEQPQRFEKALYNTIKAPANYVGSLFQANFMALADASGQLSIVDKAKLLALPKNEIRLLSELSTAAGELGKFSMAGDHTDIDALMKNFSNYRKNFTRVEWIRNSLNNYKRTYDQKIMSLYAAAKRGQTTVMVDGEPVAIKDRIKFLQNEFKNKTGYRLGGFKIDVKGKPYIEPTTPRIPDIKNPVNTVLRQTLEGLGTYRMPGQEAIKITNAFDKAIQKAKTVNERVDLFKKWKGKSELLNSRYINAAGSIPRLKNLVKLLTAGTIALGGMTALAQADVGTATAEGATLGDYIKGGAGVATGAAITQPKQAWEIAKKYAVGPLEKVIAPFLTPSISIAAHGKPDVTSGLEWITPAFWNTMTKRFGLTGTIEAFKNAPDAASKSKIAINMLLRAGIPMKALPIISGAAATVSGPLLVSDAAKLLQSKIDKEGLTGLIEEQSGMIGDEAGASLFMEDVRKEKKRRDAEGMDYFNGGIASLK